MSYCDLNGCSENSKQRQIFIKVFAVIMMIAAVKSAATRTTTKTKAETKTKSITKTKTTTTPVNSDIFSYVSVKQESRFSKK